MIQRPLIVVTGGGSGGHTMVAAATISHLLEKGVASFAYLGSHDGVEGPTARGLGVPFFSIRTGKLRRANTWYGLLTVRNALDTFNVSAGLAQAARLLRRLRPALVLSTGGFVAVPVVWAAGALGIPVVIHEQTLQLGLANRLSAGIAQRIALSDRLAFDSLPVRWRGKATVTGAPIREGILTGDASRARERFLLRATLPTVLITGGAQGAETLNQAVLDAMPSLLRECSPGLACMPKCSPCSETPSEWRRCQRPLRSSRRLERRRSSGSSSLPLAVAGGTPSSGPPWVP